MNVQVRKEGTWRKRHRKEYKHISHMYKLMCVWLCVSSTFTFRETNWQTHQPWLFPQVFHCSIYIYLLAFLNTTNFSLWEFEMVSSCSLPPCLMFLLYSHPLQLSGRGCMPPPTPIALPSITLRWQQTDTSSHTHSDLNITLLHSAATHISYCAGLRVFISWKLLSALSRDYSCSAVHGSIKH